MKTLFAIHRKNAFKSTWHGTRITCVRPNPRGLPAALSFMQNKKAIPFGMTFCFGDMTVSYYRFVISHVFTWSFLYVEKKRLLRVSDNSMIAFIVSSSF